MSASPLLAFAERHDLDYAERVARRAWNRSPFPPGEVHEIAGGRLPGGANGLVGRLTRQTDREAGARRFTLVVTRLPESLAFVRFLSCTEARLLDVIDLGSALGLMDQFEFESLEFNRRYQVAMFRGGNENRLRQLFSPTFVDWMANTAPEGLYWGLSLGVLTVTFAQQETNEADDFERTCELAGHVAERIRSEALEGVGLGGDPSSRGGAEWAQFEANLDAQLEEAGLTSEVRDVTSTAGRLAPGLRREKGILGRLSRSRNRNEAEGLAMFAMLRSYAKRAGLEVQRPEIFEMLPFGNVALPLPLSRQLSLRGELPGVGLPGKLIAFVDLIASRDGLAYLPAIEVATAAIQEGFIHVLSHADDRDATAVGPFSVELDEGTRRESEASRTERDAAAALAHSLGVRYDVIAWGTHGNLIGETARAWLAEDGGHALLLEGGTLTLVGAPQPALEWSFETLDAFTTSAAPVVEDLRAATAS